jgi:hypothetical protein
MSSPQRVGRWWRWWIVGYMVLVGLVVGTMFRLRQSAVPELSSQKSISDWREWKEANVKEQQSHKGPVERRVPKSDEPPALVLMRDFFAVLMAGALLFSSLLYWIMAWFVTGILRAP